LSCCLNRVPDAAGLLPTIPVAADVEQMQCCFSVCRFSACRFSACRSTLLEHCRTHASMAVDSRRLRRRSGRAAVEGKALTRTAASCGGGCVLPKRLPHAAMVLSISWEPTPPLLMRCEINEAPSKQAPLDVAAKVLGSAAERGRRALSRLTRASGALLRTRLLSRRGLRVGAEAASSAGAYVILLKQNALL